MNYEVKVAGKPVSFSIMHNKIFWNCDLENEKIAALISGIRDLDLSFMLCVKALLDEIGEEAFKRQYIYWQKMQKDPRAALIPERVNENNSKGEDECLYFLYAAFGGIYSAISSISSLSILQELAYVPMSNIREEVAKSPRTPSRTLRMLAQDVEPRVCQAVARNPNTDQDVVLGLALRDSTTRLAALHNPKYKEILCRIYAKDGFGEGIHAVRAEIARITSDEDLILEFAQNDSWLVRRNLIDNPNVTPKALEILKTESNDQNFLRNRAERILMNKEKQISPSQHEEITNEI